MPNASSSFQARMARANQRIAPSLLRDTLCILEYINADTIAEGLSAFAPESAALNAGRIMLERLDELAA